MNGALIREAVQDGRRVAILRCYDGIEGQTIVEAEVTSVAGGEHRRGPYHFATASEAFRFIQESLLALQYLGCTIVAV